MKRNTNFNTKYNFKIKINNIALLYIKNKNMLCNILLDVSAYDFYY